MFRVTVSDRKAEDLSCRSKRTLSNIQSAAVLNDRDHFHHFRGFDFIDRTCTQSGQDVGFHSPIDAVGVALASAFTPMSKPRLGDGLEGVFVFEVVLVLFGLPIFHWVSAR